MKRILATVATATLALGGLVATATSASAHNQNIHDVCGSLSVDLRSYAPADGGRSNTVTIVIDEDTVVEQSFGRDFQRTFELSKDEKHSWSVVVDAHDGKQYDVNESDTIEACEEGPVEETKVETAFYVYPKLDANKPANWTNSGYQTLIATRDGGEFWEELPESYPGDLFDVADLPADVCEGSWGVQQDIVGIHEGFDWAKYEHITYPDGPLFQDLRDDRHDELSNYFPECGENAEGQVVLPAPSPVESCDAENTVTLPPTDDAVYTEDWNEDRSQVTVTAVPAEGVVLAPDAVTEWTFEFTGEICATEPVVVTPEAPVVVDLCGVENDDLVVPDSTDEIAYSSVDEGILATAAEGATLGDLPEGFTAVDESTALFAVDESAFTDEECGLIPGDIAAVCDSAVPYLSYAVSLPEGVEVDSDTPLTVTFINPDGENHVTTDLPLEGRLLWPGASATEPLQWPGWELVDGAYVETEGNFAWTRDDVQVLFEVNPDYSTVVTYPEASTECANPPSDVRLAAQESVVDASGDTDDVAAQTAAELPKTGATVGIAAGVAALLLAAGVTLFLVRRRLGQR